MKKWLFAVLVIVAITVIALLPKIKELNALRLYSNVFERETIDQNFRSLYQQYPSIKFPKSSNFYEIERGKNFFQLSENFNFEGKSINTEEWLARTHTTGLAIMSGDQMIHERYFRGNSESSKSIIMSVSKSMTSMLIGVALDEGHIKSIDDPVVAYVPELKGSAYDDGVTIKHVLQMSSGIRWNEDYGNLGSDLVRSVVATLIGSLDEFSKTIPRENKPGTFNRYASIETQVLGMVLRGATSRPYQDYFQEKLWAKLGVEHDAYMLVDSTGEPVVYGGMNVSLRDMLRFGKLYLDQGVNYRGQQLVDPKWIAQSTVANGEHVQPGVNNPNSDSGFGYGYQWWLPLNPKNDYAAIGIYGQFIYVNPKLNVVIVKTSAYPDYTIDGGMMSHETLVAFQQFAEEIAENYNGKNH